MFYKLIFVFMSLICVNLFAEELENIKAFEAKFKQTIINNVNKKIVYTGMIYIREPSNFVWKYESPIVKSVYINRDFAIIVEPELEQAIYTSLKNEINIIKLLTEAKKIDENKYLAQLYDVKYNITVENRRIKSIQYEDEIENSITIEFSDILQNHAINEAHFKFKAPMGYDIIRK